jgi:hypothetical protein
MSPVATVSVTFSAPLFRVVDRVNSHAQVSAEDGQGGVYLSDHLLRDLALLPVSLALDIYAGAGPDE